MQSEIWKNAAAVSADPLRVDGFVTQLTKTSAASALDAASPEQARILCALLAGSEASGRVLTLHPDWVAGLMEPQALEFPRNEQGLRREVSEWLEPMLQTMDYSGALSRLRLFKQREMVRIAARDLARLGNTEQTVREISSVADICTECVYRICWRQLTERFGKPHHLNAREQWEETQFCVIGLGKLGGQELNYSSDIDVVFVYTEEGYAFKAVPKGSSEAGHGLSNHAFFLKLSEALIGEISRMTPEGSLFRIDLRLRPEGDAGPLCRSLESYENYYSQWGQTWERMMLIKARLVAGDRELGAEFIEMVHPFRYPRSLSDRTLGEISSMKKRIENEVVRAGELDRNVKLGRGGIREIEFTAQTLQILHAGHQPFLQNHQTIATLHKAVHYHLLSPEEVKGLHEAYYFLRDVEHRLQMDDYQQTHTIPLDAAARTRLAKLMGFDGWDGFEKAKATHCQFVRAVYEKVIPSEGGPGSPKLLPDYFDTERDQWMSLLERHSFRDLDQAFRMVVTFIDGPGYVHVTPRTVELARDLFPKFLALCPQKGEPVTKPVLSDPDRVMVRLDSFVSAYGARSTLYELWAQHPSLFELLLWLFDRSEFLAETAIRTPDLVDDLELSGRLRRPKAAMDILRDLRFGRNDEDQRLWLRRYHQAELMRIGLRDILGMADFTQSLIEISALADACLQYALEVVMRKHRLKTPPFCIIGLGKLGGREINYGSDLDIIFITRATTKKLPPLQKMAVEVMDLLSAQTEQGIVFKTDARLRPDGEKGLLVNNLEAYEDYYRHRACLWEIQTITRTRPIAGDMSLGAQFQSLAAALANFAPENVAAGFPSHDAAGAPSPLTGLAAFKPDWKKQIAHMRERIEKERTPSGKESLAIKTGAGGLIDAEFLAQTLCLANGWQEPNTTQALTRACESGVLSAEDGKTLLDNYRQLHRIECILRRWSFEGEVLLPDDPAPLYRVAVRCGYQNAEAFMQAIKSIRAQIRMVYSKAFAMR